MARATRPSENQSLDIRPVDSISNAGSFASSRSRARSKTGSMRSSASAKARAAVKKAALEAKAVALRELHELQFEELRIQQRKTEVELQVEIAVAEAEKRVYEQSEADEARDFHLYRNNNIQDKPLAVQSQQVRSVSTPLEEASTSNQVQQRPLSEQPRRPPKDTPLSTKQPLNLRLSNIAVTSILVSTADGNARPSEPRPSAVDTATRCYGAYTTAAYYESLQWRTHRLL